MLPANMIFSDFGSFRLISCLLVFIITYFLGPHYRAHWKVMGSMWKLVGGQVQSSCRKRIERGRSTRLEPPLAIKPLFCGGCRKTCHFYTELTHCLKVCNKCVRPSQICVLEANPRKMSRHGKGQIMFCSEICKNSLVCNKMVTFCFQIIKK